MARAARTGAPERPFVPPPRGRLALLLGAALAALGLAACIQRALPPEVPPAARSPASSARERRLAHEPRGGQEGAADAGRAEPLAGLDLQHAEVMQYQWYFIRNQLGQFKQDIADIQSAVTALQQASAQHSAWEEGASRQMQDTLGAQASHEARNAAWREKLDRLCDDLHTKSVEQPPALEADLRGVAATLRRELAEALAGQSAQQQALGEHVEESLASMQTRLRDEVSRHAQDTQVTYVQSREFLEVLGQHDLILQKQIAELSREHHEGRLEACTQLQGTFEAANSTLKADLDRLSAGHGMRHDQADESLRTSAEQVRALLREEIQRVEAEHCKDYTELRKLFQDSLDELDMKVNEVEVLYCEAHERRRESHYLSYKYSTK